MIKIARRKTVRWSARFSVRFGLLFAIALGFCLGWHAVIAHPVTAHSVATDSIVAQRPASQSTTISPPTAESIGQGTDAEGLAAEGRSRYLAGDWQGTVTVLQQAAQVYERQGDWLRLALVSSNLGLVYQQQSNWTAANQAIDRSRDLLSRFAPAHPATEWQQALAQTLNIQGQIQLAQGRAEAAVQSWEQSAAAYEQIPDRAGVLKSWLNQAQALQTLGFNRRAVDRLTALSQTLTDGDPLLLQISLWRSLSDQLQTIGDLERAEQALQQAQQLMQIAGDTPETQAVVAALHLSQANLWHSQAITRLQLANLTPAQVQQVLAQRPPTDSLPAIALWQQQVTAAQQFVQQMQQAIEQYQQAIETAEIATDRIQAGLNQLTALLELQRWSIAVERIPPLQTQIDQQPRHQITWNQQIQLVLAQISLAQASAIPVSAVDATITQRLQQAAEQSEINSDRRTAAFGYGQLAAWYEFQRNPAAMPLTEQALMLAQSINAADLAYRWQWQLGRLWQQQGDRSQAIAAYREAIVSLQALRNDLVSINQNIQFSFQTQVEPVYREFVSLLLDTDPLPDQLLQARQTIEALQIAELDNFFREACLETQFAIDRVVDQDDQTAAVFYTILLPDRLEVILKLPQQPLQRYRTPVPQTTVETTVEKLLAEVKRPYRSQQFTALSQQVYDWLIRPVEPALAQSNIATLVFVLDGSLRTLPLATLSDGQQFLIEKYSLALAPGLQLTNPQPLQQKPLKVLLAGLSEARADFSALNYVTQEVADIQANLPSQVLLNQRFTEENFRKQLDAAAYPIVHVATHGQFSSNLADTFILAWDRPIGINQLSQLLQVEETRAEPVELLVLSACRTAAGDRRAGLGMAGMAVRSGARSTIASLWSLDDGSGAALMEQFYQVLTAAPLSKAEALRQAQIALLRDPQYGAPRFWGPYVLLGNWL